MKITRSQLRNIVKEAIDVHLAPDDLDVMGPEETYGVGYYKGKDCDPDSDDDGFLSIAELIGMTQDVSADLDVGRGSYGDVPGASRSGLAASFAKEAEAKSAALSGATSFHDSLAAAGTEIDDEILGRIYAALLDSAHVLQGNVQ